MKHVCQLLHGHAVRQLFFNIGSNTIDEVMLLSRPLFPRNYESRIDIFENDVLKQTDRFAFQ